MSPRIQFEINGHVYQHAYWLADGIYPEYQCFVKTMSKPTTRMQQYFATKQEYKRKDIERTFGVLQARFHILTAPCRLWNRDAMKTVIHTCVILHNLIIDYDWEHRMDGNYIADVQYVPRHPFELIPREKNQAEMVAKQLIREMQDGTGHHQLQHDIMVHMWDLMAQENIDD